MPSAIAPWLADLDEDWVQPVTLPMTSMEPALVYADSAQRSLNSSKSRIPRRSSGEYSFQHQRHEQNGSINSSVSTRRTRQPLGELSVSAGNALGDETECGRDIGSRSASVFSAGSVVHHETVARRANSSSPAKKQATFEWRKRLVHGEVGYGDQTDLFGPSGLENIFQSPSKQSPSNLEGKHSSRGRFRRQDIMPSSPPPWPSSVDASLVRSSFDQQEPDQELEALKEEEDLLEELLEDEVLSQQEQELATIADAEYQRENDSKADASNIEDQLEDDSANETVSEAYEDGSLRRHPKHPHNTRTVSGQSELTNEEFSPVFISKHTTINGEVGYAPLDSQMAKLMQKASLREEHMGLDVRLPLDTLPKSESEATFRPDEDTNSFVDESMPGVPEISLPDNLPTGTPPIARLGSFVTTQRGGLSNCGSFKTRPLSPSPPESRKVSEGNPQIPSIREDDSHFGGHEPSEHHTNGAGTPSPATPPSKQVSSLLSPSKTRSSASPLKLFGDYDTFTNKRLLRRMSQLEGLEEGHALEKTDQTARPYSQQSNMDGEESANGSMSRSAMLHPPSFSHSQTASKLCSFGEGDLDEQDFEANLSFPSDEDYDQSQNSMEGSPPPGVMPPGARSPFQFHIEASQDIQEEQSNLKRKLSKRSTAKSNATNEFRSSQQHSFWSERLEHSPAFGEDVAQGRQHDGDNSEGKRPRNSPCKAPTPKRRRTLHAMDLEPFVEPEQAQSLTHDDEPSGTVQKGSPPKTRPLYGTYRPRNPTPSQRRQQEVQVEIDQATAEFLASSPRLEAIKEQIEAADIPGSFNLAHQAKAVASEVAAFTLNVPKVQLDGERKRSITTQDFLNEAMHIMSIIRARGSRPQSGLGSVEESEEDRISGQYLHPDQENFDASLSSLRLSRPPSREGREGGWRPRSQQQDDRRIISQLRKFEERGDIDIIDTTLRSLHLMDQENGMPQGDDGPVNPAVDIRISGPRSEGEREKAPLNASVSQNGDSLKSNLSGDFSTGRTTGSNTTRKSDNVATLAPETVAHLIPEEVAGMTFDRAEGRWVRIKGSRRRRDREDRASPNPSNITSDDDPFGEIPDLTVDEVKELDRVRSARSSNNVFESIEASQTQDFVNQTSQTEVDSRPSSRDAHTSHPFSSSSKPTGGSAFASSQQQPETRATSWSNGHLASKSQSEQHIITSFDSYERSDPFDLAYYEAGQEDLSKLDASQHSVVVDEDQSALEGSEVEELPSLLHHQPTYASSPRPAYRGATNGVSLRRQTLHRVHQTTCREQSEVSIFAELPDKRLMSVSVSVSRPPMVSAPPSHELALHSSPQESRSYILSDLPDFTVNDIEAVGPSENALAARVAQHAIDTISDRYAMAVQTIVKTLTDVQSDEPYWEDIKSLSLTGKSLDSLHGLENFCLRVQELDISHNSINQVEGAPSSVRWLNASFNSLHSLTAWNHLQNLQHLDISNNDMDDLNGLSGLLHLRELVANNNHITSLDGIRDLDGLLKLCVKGNRLEDLDFADTQLRRLRDLDLSHNQMKRVVNIASLSALENLVLDDNKLESFCSGLDTGSGSRLEVLSLRQNKIDALDISSFPRLRLVDADSNRLCSIIGLSGANQLDTLSMRSQSSIPALRIFEQPLHVRNVYASASQVSPVVDLPHTYHSIQHLCLASCGITNLPDDFGLKFPNLRTLNLNFNNLRDVRPLLNIMRLEELHLAGNRIARLRKCIATLAKMTMLKTLDCRDNAFTMGFYTPASLSSKEETQLVPSASDNQHESDIEAELRKAQEVRQRSYLLPEAEADADKTHASKLDEDTTLRRRVYELLLANGCKKLQRLDGLVFERERAMVKDRVWERLVHLGVVRKSNNGDGKEGLGSAELEAVV